MDVLAAITFHRHDQALRAVMIDNQPWFVVPDVSRLIGLHHPTVLARSVYPDDLRPVRLRGDCGVVSVEVLNEPALYEALGRHRHPGSQGLGQWLRESVIPPLLDLQESAPQLPRHRDLGFLDIPALDWQGDVWVTREEMPTFERVDDKPTGPKGFWRR